MTPNTMQSKDKWQTTKKTNKNTLKIKGWGEPKLTTLKSWEEKLGKGHEWFF
jgi:hypothetical protein